MALSEISNNVIDLLHSVPINFLSVAASTTEGLVARVSSPRGEYVKLRQAALQKYMREEAQGASEQVKRLWEKRHNENGFVVRVYATAGVPMSDLNAQEKQEREAFFRKSVKVWRDIRDILTRLENEMIGPYTLGVYGPYKYQGRELTLFSFLLGLKATSYPWLTCILVHGSPASFSSLVRPPLQVHCRRLPGRGTHPLNRCILGSRIWKTR